MEVRLLFLRLSVGTPRAVLFLCCVVDLLCGKQWDDGDLARSSTRRFSFIIMHPGFLLRFVAESVRTLLLIVEECWTFIAIKILYKQSYHSLYAYRPEQGGDIWVILAATTA